jgi:pre-mRNA-splicing factor ATP-dependent RNA helicase DHX38/PRP16
MADFNHQLAIKLSRALNTLNPNDLLAQRVTDIAKTNSVEGFVKGVLCGLWFLSFSLTAFAAARAFGKFQDSFLQELHAEVLLHVKQEATGVVPKPVEGITVHDSDVLEPEPVRPGGLMMRADTVRENVVLRLSVDCCP